MNKRLKFATVKDDGWTLISAEDHAKANPKTFLIPSEAERDSLAPGNGVKLLFDIETKENGQVIDRGVDRMWVIVKRKVDDGYLGVLDSDPGQAENLQLRPGSLVAFKPEHVAVIRHPPRQYVLDNYGSDFFEN